MRLEGNDLRALHTAKAEVDNVAKQTATDNAKQCLMVYLDLNSSLNWRLSPLIGLASELAFRIYNVEVLPF
jgi:hypothetical protein